MFMTVEEIREFVQLDLFYFLIDFLLCISFELKSSGIMENSLLQDCSAHRK